MDKITEFKEIKISLDFFVSFLCQDKNEKTSKETINAIRFASRQLRSTSRFPLNNKKWMSKMKEH